MGFNSTYEEDKEQSLKDMRLTLDGKPLFQDEYFEKKGLLVKIKDRITALLSVFGAWIGN